jgi:hypothetical protein
MGWIIAASVLLQIYFAFTCSIWWANFWDRGLMLDRPLDEMLLHWLAVTKVVAAPVSFILLAARPVWGRTFTGALFTVYGVCGLAMPLFAGDGRPMAWWPNTRAAGEGPLMSFIFFGLGLVLLANRRPTSPPQAAASTLPGAP